MLIKVYGGTRPQEQESLCDSCRHSGIVRGRTLKEEIVFCRALVMQSVRITFKVTSCSDYDDDREPSYCELVEKAWILTPGSRRRPAGFVRAADLGDDERYRFLSASRERS
jgi:hypothetical protein